MLIIPLLFGLSYYTSGYTSGLKGLENDQKNPLVCIKYIFFCGCEKIIGDYIIFYKPIRIQPNSANL